MISAVLCTIRKEPRFDWMADSWALNLRKHDEIDAELIVVDGRLWYDDERRAKLSEAVDGRFPYRHLGPKPSAWQGPYRKTSRDYYDLCGARNTGIAAAFGTHIILFDDCSVLDDNFLYWHYRAARAKIAMAGSFRSYVTAKVSRGRVVDGELHPSGEDARGQSVKQAPGAWLWGLNLSFPLEVALAVNGYDELYSGQGGSEDCDFGVRIERAGCNIAYQPECRIYQILETHETVCEDVNRWDNTQTSKQKELRLRDGKLHFANERLIQDLADEPSRIHSRGNDFFLRELRERYQREGTWPTKRLVTTDWRDGQPLGTM